MQTLFLKPKEDRRITSGHLWVFSNEVDNTKSPLSAFSAGEDVTIVAANGTPIGSATINPHALICARIHSTHPNTPLDHNLVANRLQTAFAFRQQAFQQPYYRLCHGEGDLLPGLVIDRFGETLTVQITTKAMEMRKASVCEVLTKTLPALFPHDWAIHGIFFDNAIPMRNLEGLSPIPDTIGTVPEDLSIPENGLTMKAPLQQGQKTGWFYDQRANRLLAARYAKHCDVLDAFCYVGGFGVCAASFGAKSLTFLDAQQRALDYAKINCAANAPDLLPSASFFCGDALTMLQQFYAEGRRFDWISLDPPAFIKRRKDIQQGLITYRRLHVLALRLLRPYGYLISSSCSYHLTQESLLDAIKRAAAKNALVPQILSLGRQDCDHPELLGMPETSYLKCAIVRLCPSS
ncbi:MAG: class I SAM-dependent rRNA methyltransferase [Desulfovibrio sp.]|nr:class I SAM-dependent rRNA methyltransferase [Desulfovibrio sp.]